MNRKEFLRQVDKLVRMLDGVSAPSSNIKQVTIYYGDEVYEVHRDANPMRYFTEEEKNERVP